MTPARRKDLDAQYPQGLQVVVRTTETQFNLDAMLARFDELWGKGV